MLSSAQRVLQGALVAPPASLPATAAKCKHPTRPAPLRRLCDFSESCVELLVASTSSGRPCCLLPNAPPRGIQARGLFSLIRLDSLSEETVVDRLAAVEGHVANTCSACPSLDAPQQLPPSPLVYSPEFSCFLERCLELAQTHKDLGVAPAVLLLQIVSRLNYAADDSLRDSFSRYYLHLQVELEAAVELHTESITPQVALAVYQAWADLGSLPMISSTFGLVLREHIKAGAFSPQELSRLLSAMASLRAARPNYRPCQYDVADICGGLLTSNLRELAAPHLASVAASLGFFPWPVYQCVLPLLESVAEEAVRRQAVGEMSPAASAALLARAAASAGKLNPRLGAELEAKVAVWKAQARLCTGSNIIPRFANTYPAANSEELAAFM